MSVQARSNEITRWLAVGGIVGPVMFVVAFTVADIVRPGYSVVHQAISDLGVGSNPLLLNAPLVAMGVLLAAFIVGFTRGVGAALGDPWRWIGTVLLALPPFGFAWAGIFTEAPATVTLHWLVGMPPVAIGSVAAFLVIGLRLRRLAGWAAWGAYSIIAAVATVAVFAAMFLLWRYGVGGLLERLLFVEVLAWYVVFGWRIFRGAASASSPVSGRPVQRSVPSS